MGPGVLSRSSCRLLSPTAQELLACTCVETEWSTKCKTGRCRELGYTIAIASKRLTRGRFELRFEIRSTVVWYFSKIPNVVLNSIVTRESQFFPRIHEQSIQRYLLTQFRFCSQHRAATDRPLFIEAIKHDEDRPFSSAPQCFPSSGSALRAAAAAACRRPRRPMRSSVKLGPFYCPRPARTARAWRRCPFRASGSGPGR